MSDALYIPDFHTLLPASDFNSLISRVGVRIAWMKSRTCPCIYGGGGQNGVLPFAGTADPACLTCFGVGRYWDNPLTPMVMLMTFITVESTSFEPGIHTDENWGGIVTAAPMLSIPSWNPYLSLTDPAQPRVVWDNASVGDFFVSVDKLSRYTAVLQVGGNTLLPYQQNLQIEPVGAVAVYDPVSHAVSYPSYVVDGAAVTLPSTFPLDTTYIVEFQAAPIYAAYSKSGGLAHVRDFGQGTENLPRRFRLQTLDLWSRQYLSQAQAAGSIRLGGTAVALATLSGMASLG
jgi:hypothetical protein